MSDWEKMQAELRMQALFTADNLLDEAGFSAIGESILARLIEIWGFDDIDGLKIWLTTENEWLSGHLPMTMRCEYPHDVLYALQRGVEL